MHTAERPRMERAGLWVAAPTLLMLAALGASCAKEKPSWSPAAASAPPLLNVAAESGQLASLETGEAANGSSTEIEFTEEPWRFGEFDGLRIATKRYEVFTTVSHATVLEQLPIFYEKAVDIYTSALGDLPQPPNALRSYLFGDRQQWQAMTQQMLPDQADMFMSLGRGGFTTRGVSVLYYIDFWSWPHDTFAIAAHEGWHQYTQTTFRQHLPVWLEEGIATYMEGLRTSRNEAPRFQPERNYERWRTLRDAVRRDRLISMSELVQRSPQSFLENSKDDLLIYYAQVWALTRFLAEGEDGRYREGLEALLSDAANGRMFERVREVRGDTSSRRSFMRTARSGTAALTVYVNGDLTELERQYNAFIEQVIDERPQEWSRRGRRGQ